ncbi:sulfurtransferase TusA family protein [Sulfoacidibacillus thermotolerans]|nr:sulfurtransferase TusA family protein [Sulfoacidibacillus thermotolerans]
MGEQWTSDGVCDGGDLDCGSGLLLIIKKAMEPIPSGGVLEVHSREPSVVVDLPAWCRMVGHDFLGVQTRTADRAFFIRKKAEIAELQSELEAARGYKWSVRIRGKEGLLAQAYARNHSFLVGQPTDFGATVDAPSGVDFLLAALGSDLVVGLKATASRSQVLLDEIECTLRASLGNVLYAIGLEEQGSPAIEEITGVLYVASSAEEQEVRNLFVQTVARSPMYQTLQRTCRLNVRLEITF